MKLIYISILCLLIAHISFAQDITIASFASGFDKPVSIKNAGDLRLFIVEQDGLIRILNDDGTIETTPFLNIDSIVFNPSFPGDERGLLGLTFHPNYNANGFFYVNYINNSGDTVISRFTRDAANPNLADQTSETPILTITQPFANHNGGDMEFGPDGFLYISSGDGGDGGDPQNNGQQLNTLLGKILRIDVDGGSPYSVPTSNPFFNDGDANTLDEIWAYGLRNTWKFSFDSQTGDVWIADVGQGVFEEINFVGATDPNFNSGLNFGWRCYEASAPFNTNNCADISTFEFPVGEYSHSGDGIFKCSITGGYRYRGTAQANFTGLYFFADYCSDEIGTLENVGGNWVRTFSDAFPGNGWTAFGEDINGELYICGIDSGEVFKVVDGSLSINENELQTFKMFPNPAENNVTFDFTHSAPTAINIYDIQGKMMKQVTTFESSIFDISIVTLAKGLYIVEVINSNGQSTYKKLVTK